MSELKALLEGKTSKELKINDLERESHNLYTSIKIPFTTYDPTTKRKLLEGIARAYGGTYKLHSKLHADGIYTIPMLPGKPSVKVPGASTYTYIAEVNGYPVALVQFRYRMPDAHDETRIVLSNYDPIALGKALSVVAKYILGQL